MSRSRQDHVLVVEDDPVNARVVEAGFRRAGFQVTITEDVDEILQLAREKAVDLVVMDIALGSSFHEGKQVDGVAISRILKDDPRTSSIPIVLATAFAMKGDRERFLEASRADGYLTKPFSLKKLVEVAAGLMGPSPDEAPPPSG